MSTATSARPATAPSLRRLYFTRAAFALVWAGLVAATASASHTLAAVLLVLYPLVDAAAAVVDARTAKAAGPVFGLYVNIAVSLVAAAGLALAASSGNPALLRVWGAWAIVSGVIQLAVGVVRRRMGGQWPLIISGAGSVAAGSSFIVMAAGDEPSLGVLAGYAAVGGIFFLVSALRLGRAAG